MTNVKWAEMHLALQCPLYPADPKAINEDVNRYLRYCTVFFGFRYIYRYYIFGINFMNLLIHLCE
jgi:hypothetical protein